MLTKDVLNALERFGTDAFERHGGMPDGESCGTCAHCLRATARKYSSPFRFTSLPARMGDDFGICVEEPMDAVLVALDCDWHDEDCPCGGDGWEPRGRFDE